MTVGDLPLAALAPIDMGDAQRVRLGRDAVNGHGRVFIADCIGKVPTEARSHEVEGERGAVGEPRSQPTEGLADLLSARNAFRCAEHGHWIIPGPQRQARFRVAIVKGFVCRELAGERRGEEVVEFTVAVTRWISCSRYPVVLARSRACGESGSIRVMHHNYLSTSGITSSSLCTSTQ
ncbi:MAG TPA: hypothetical protein VGP82_11640 [Ktedonobacterales bacterium]|jgi:hypothetical protein|nr:hypothetical protein [Ktedonobacterales bacterium]